MKKIVTKSINELNDLLSDKKIKLHLTDLAIEHLIKVGFDSRMGARPVQRKINELIKVPISKKILFEKIEVGSIIMVDCKDDKFVFDITDANMEDMELLTHNKVVDENGIIVIE